MSTIAPRGFFLARLCAASLCVMLSTACATLSGGAKESFARSFACPVENVTILHEAPIDDEHSTLEKASFEVTGCGRRAKVDCNHPVNVSASGRASMDPSHVECVPFQLR
jgi:hypothetical protein